MYDHHVIAYLIYRCIRQGAVPALQQETSI